MILRYGKTLAWAHNCTKREIWAHITRFTMLRFIDFRCQANKVRYCVLRVIVLVSFRRFVLLNILSVCFPFYFIIDHEIRKITNVLLIICAKYQPWICVGIMEEVVEIERNTMIVQTGFMLKVYVIVNVTRLNVVYLVSMIIRYLISVLHFLQASFICR